MLILFFINILLIKRECFMEYFTHKFRATIGKNKILEKNESVLVPYSGSGSKNDSFY